MRYDHLLALVTAICLSCLGDLAAQNWSECSTPTSCLPDTDATGFNNSQATAVDLGEARDPATGQPRTLSANGQLGEVQTGFDTVDYFKFRLPPELFEVEFTARETPDTSSWIMIYDSQGNALIKEQEGRGQAHERVVLSLAAGTYYVSVATDAEVAKAKGGKLGYALAVRPIQRSLPNDGVADCGASANRQFVDGGRAFSGTFETHVRHTYPIALSRSARVATPLRKPRRYETAIVDLTTNERFSMSDQVSVDPIYKTFDPGFYCLEVDLTQPVNLPLNYTFELFSSAGGFQMGRERSVNAPCLPSFNVGSSRNGRYEGSKHKNGTPCPLEDSVEYVAREWVGTQQPEGWIRVYLAQPRKVDIALSNLYSPVRAEIQDVNGAIVGTTSVSSFSISDQLPHQIWSGTLPQGMHYLRVMHLGTRSGTSFQLRLTARP